MLSIKLKNRNFKDGAYFLLSYLSKISLPLIPVFLIFRNLTSEEITIYLLLNLIFSIGQGIQTGFRTAFVRYLSYALNGLPLDKFGEKQDGQFTPTSDIEIIRNNTSNVFSIMKTVYRFSTALYIFVVLVVSATLLLDAFIALPTPSEGLITFIIFTILTSLSFFYNLYSASLYGNNKVDIVEKIRFLTNLLMIVLYALTWKYINKLPMLIIFVYGGQLVSALILFLYHKYRLELFHSSIIKFDKNLFLKLWKGTSKNVYTSFAANIAQNAIGLILPSIVTHNQVNAFLITKKGFDIISEVSFIPFNAYLPSISGNRIKFKNKDFIKKLINLEIICLSILICGIVIFVFLKSHLIFIIGKTGLSFLENFEFFLLAIFIIQNRWSSIKLFISNLLNNIIEHKVITIYILSITTILLLKREFDLIDLIKVFIFSHLISIIPIVFFYYKNNFQISIWKYESIQFLILTLSILILWIVI